VPLAALLNTSDLHEGDRAHTRRTLDDCMDRAIARIGQVNPERVDWLLNGDTIAGRGVFRGQDVDNLLQLGAEQVLVAAWRIHNWAGRIQTIGLTGATPRQLAVHVTLGHHDATNKDATNPQLVALLRLLGLAAQYHGRYYLHAVPGYGHLYAQHGFGSSQFYPISMAQIRGGLRDVVDAALSGGVVIRRLLFGHTHQTVLGQPLSSELCADVTGGWTRPPENKLNWKADRQPGVLLYLSGAGEFQAAVIKPDDEIRRAELQDPDLPISNMEATAHTLRAVSQWARSQGLIP
jgi:hypothetical protein